VYIQEMNYEDSMTVCLTLQHLNLAFLGL